MSEFLSMIDSLLAGEEWSREQLMHKRAVALDELNQKSEPMDIKEQDADTQTAIKFLIDKPLLHFPEKSVAQSRGSVHDIPVPELQAALSSASFNCQQLQIATNGHALSCLLIHLLTLHGLQGEKVKDLAIAIENSYIDNAYHNSVHAACVLHAMYHLLHTGGVLTALQGVDNQLVLLAAYLAAAAHDMRHPGVNNALLVSVKADLALLHNDQSVCENHHLVELFKLLDQPHLNVLADLDEKSFRFVRSLMIQMVLRTDMHTHNQTLREVREANAAGGVQPQLLMQFTLKVADLSHTTYPWATHCTWVNALEQEFFKQGDLERKMNMPVSPLMDRQAPGVQSTQVAFLGVVVQPLMVLFVSMFPDASYLVQGLQDNMQKWHASAAV